MSKFHETGETFKIITLHVDESAIDHAVRTLVPGSTSAKQGSIPIYSSGPPMDATLSELLMIQENKMFDIFLFLNLRTTGLLGIFSMYQNVPPTEDFELEKALEHYHKVIASLALEYVAHGTFRVVGDDSPELVKLVTEGFGIGPESFQQRMICSLPDMSKLRFPGVLDQFMLGFKHMYGSARGRFLLGVAGNRVFAVVRYFYSDLTKVAPTDDFFKLLFNIKTLERVPIISAHPDHPKNPFKNKMKYIMAYIGETLKRNGGSIPTKDDMKKQRGLPIAGLFRPFVIDQLNGETRLFSGGAPTQEAFLVALQDKYSLPRTLELARINGTLNLN